MTYTPQEIAKTIDLACLKPTASREDVRDTCALANKHDIISVCVAPTWVQYASTIHNNISCVIGFPHGNACPSSKWEDAKRAIDHGAKELDVVINYGRMLDGDTMPVADELWAIIRAAKERSTEVKVKAILESCYYTQPQLLHAANLCVEFGVDWLKTSTGFASGGATPEAIETLLLAAKGSLCEVKASGGIRTYKDVETYLDMGCTRLGTSGFLNLLPEVIEHPAQTENY